jgi:hypothetical protein
LHISVLSIKNSERVKTLQERLSGAGFDNFIIYYGDETYRRYDGLYANVKTIITDHYADPYCLIAEDDILPTAHFRPETINRLIEDAAQLDADIILGGIKEGSKIESATTGLLSVHNYRGSQLMIIFQKFYDQILKSPIEQEFEVFCSYNNRIRKFVTFPFMAYQIDSESRFLLYKNHQKDYANFENRIKDFLSDYKPEANKN